MQFELDPTTLTPKALKAYQKVIQKKNEQFYVKKRSLFRKAEQVVRGCNSDVFIIVHNKDTDKMFSFTNDDKFNLEKISRLVLRDVQQGAILQKNRKFVEEDFDRIKKNILKIEEINKQYDPLNDTMPQKAIERENNLSLILGKKSLTEPTATTVETDEDFTNSTLKGKQVNRKQQLLKNKRQLSSSESSDDDSQRIASDGYLSPRAQATPLNYIRNEVQRYANTTRKTEPKQINLRPAHNSQPNFMNMQAKDITSHPTQNQFVMTTKKSQMSGIQQEASNFDGTFGQVSPNQDIQSQNRSMTTANHNAVQTQSFDQYNQEMMTPHSQRTYQNIPSPRGMNYPADFHRNDSHPAHQANYNVEQTHYQRLHMVPQTSNHSATYPVQSRMAAISSNQRFSYNDGNQYQRNKYNQIVSEQQMEQAVDCDDIFICNDRDEIKQNREIEYHNEPKQEKTPQKKSTPLHIYNENVQYSNQKIETPQSMVTQMDIVEDILTPQTSPTQYKNKVIAVQGVRTYVDAEQDFHVTNFNLPQQRDINKQKISQFEGNNNNKQNLGQSVDNRFVKNYNQEISEIPLQKEKVQYQAISQQYNYNINVKYEQDYQNQRQENFDDSYPNQIADNMQGRSNQIQQYIAPAQFDYTILQNQKEGPRDRTASFS